MNSFILVAMNKFFRLKYVSGIALVLAFSGFLACDPNDPVDPAPPPPPPQTRVDTLLGTYTGECIQTESYMDFMTGQQVVTMDTFSHDITLLDIDTSVYGSYNLEFYGTYFRYHAVSESVFPLDTLTMYFLFGTHTEDVSMIPSEGLILTYDRHNNPSGFGTTTRRCNCKKPL